MVNVDPVDVPPGVVTVTLAVPAAAIWLAVTDAVSWFALTNAVARTLPFHFTFAPETKLEPLTVNVNAALPAFSELGLRLEIEGADGLMVKIDAADVPFAVVTVTAGAPAVAIRPAGIAAVS